MANLCRQNPRSEIEDGSESRAISVADSDRTANGISQLGNRCETGTQLECFADTQSKRWRLSPQRQQQQLHRITERFGRI